MNQFSIVALAIFCACLVFSAAGAEEEDVRFGDFDDVYIVGRMFRERQRERAYGRMNADSGELHYDELEKKNWYSMYLLLIQLKVSNMKLTTKIELTTTMKLTMKKR